MFFTFKINLFQLNSYIKKFYLEYILNLMFKKKVRNVIYRKFMKVSMNKIALLINPLNNYNIIIYITKRFRMVKL